MSELNCLYLGRKTKWGECLLRNELLCKEDVLVYDKVPIYLFLIYVYQCSACMLACALLKCLVTLEARRGH